MIELRICGFGLERRSGNDNVRVVIHVGQFFHGLSCARLWGGLLDTLCFNFVQFDYLP
jgi:hypothetical protein